MNIVPARSAESGSGRETRPAASAETARLLPVVLPVTLAGGGTFVAAVWSFAGTFPAWSVVGAILALLVAATFVENFPVPVEGSPAGGVSLAAVFIVGTSVIYGWAPAVLVAFLTAALTQVIEREPATRLAYNSSVYALAGGAAGGAASVPADVGGDAAVFLAVLLGASAFFAVNIVLTTAVVARWARKPFWRLLGGTVYWTSIPFAIMASATLMLDVLWERAPVFALALVGPLVAIALYQRSVHRALSATRLALTDALTGLGNNRHFQERLQRDLDRADAEDAPLTLCLIDLDDFKAINDEFGHPVGDRVLEEVASFLRRGGEAFRLGGDEFALLLPGRGEEDGRAIATAVVERIAAAEYAHGERVTVSAGVATYPAHGMERSDFVRLADHALYRAKRQGKNQLRVYRPELPLASPPPAAHGPATPLSAATAS